MYDAILFFLTIVLSSTEQVFLQSINFKSVVKKKTSWCLQFYSFIVSRRSLLKVAVNVTAL